LGADLTNLTVVSPAVVFGPFSGQTSVMEDIFSPTRDLFVERTDEKNAVKVSRELLANFGIVSDYGVSHR